MATTVVLNQRAVRAFLRGEEGRIVSELSRRAERVLHAAGKGYETENYVGRNRARSEVRSIAPVGTRAQQTLAGALQAGRA